MRGVLLVSGVILGLSGCAQISQSRLNPFNWFGNSQNEVIADPAQRAPIVPANAVVQVLDARSLIQTITALSVDRTPDGAIIRATGEAATQGFYNAQLVLVDFSNGTATYEFRVQGPGANATLGSSASRRITAAIAVSNAELAAIRTIRVQGQSNARSTRR